MNEEFALMDCALIAISTAEEAQNLRELRDHLQTTHEGCIYHHFWSGLIRTHYHDPEYQNDFAVWGWRALRDRVLAEKLSLIDPSVYPDLHSLRTEVIEIIEQHLYEHEHVPWARNGDQFYFMRSQIVVFDSGIRLRTPEELQSIFPTISLSSIFYHFIDARRRTFESKNDFSLWLDGFSGKYGELSESLDQLDPYFTTLSTLRDDIASLFKRHLGGGAA